MVACEPLTDEQLSQLLGLELGVVRGILSRLWPLVEWGEGKPAQPFYASFRARSVTELSGKKLFLKTCECTLFPVNKIDCLTPK